MEAGGYGAVTTTDAARTEELRTRPGAITTGRIALRRLAYFAAAPHEVIRSLASSDIARGFPRYSRWLRRLIVVEVAVLVTLGFVAPLLLVLAIAAIACGAAWIAWRARPAYGAARRLPPGSWGVGSHALRDPDYFMSAWRRYGPVFKGNLFDEPMAVVVGVREAAELLATHPDGLVPTPMPWNRYIPGGLLRFMKGELHDQYRQLLVGPLGARWIRSNSELIDEEIRRTLAAMADEPRGALPLAHMEDLTFGLWSGLFFGIPRTDPAFSELAADFDIISIEKQAPSRHVESALGRIEALIGDRFRAGTPPAAVDSLLAEILRRDPGALADPVTIPNLIYLVESTSLDVAAFLVWLLKHTADNPRYVELLREARDESGPRSLADRMVSESIRLEQSEYIHRHVARDIEFGDYVIPEGWVLHVAIHESHRDPSLFPDPDEFRPERFLETRHQGDYAPFGIGDRACLGVPLTRAVARRFLHLLAEGYSPAVVDDGPRQMSAQRHWAPNERFRVQLIERAHDTVRLAD